MAVALHQWTAAIYLLAALCAVAGLSVRARRLQRSALGFLGLASVVHPLAFWRLHELHPTPALTDLPLAVSFAAWLGSLVYLVLALRLRIRGLAVVVAPAAFVAATFAAFSLEGAVAARDATLHPLWAHLHVLLGSAGLALLGVAGGAGALFLLHHRALKHKSVRAGALPSLETLDRVNALGLSLGFLLLTVGLVTGVMWAAADGAGLWPGGFHANATLAAWTFYAAVVGMRALSSPGARRSALASAAGFVVLLVVVVAAGIAP